MIVIVGASATGKSAILNELVNKHHMQKYITCTTRGKRWNEVDDIDYHFLSKEDFEEKIKNDEFIEYVTYNGNYYGTLKKEVSPEKVVILEPQGLIAFKNKQVRLFAVYLNIDENVRYERMLIRGDSKEMALERLKVDKEVFNEKIKPYIDFTINRSNLTVEELAETIYTRYMQWMNY